MSNQLTHLKELESESIYVIREVAAQFERPVLLFSGGKDSIVMAHLAYKAFYPASIPFPFLHIDTGHNFEETITYRDELVKNLGVKLIVGSVQESIDAGRAIEETGYNASRNKLQTVTLLDSIEKYKFDAALGGARRDEEKVLEKRIRCRTIGDITCTGLTLSEANTLEEIVSEITASRITERGGAVPTINAPKPPWKTGKKQGIFNS
ncbi:MAG: phosphoadenosine phosphosulfate reductase family protein [Dysgonamonadaceae bacterium]|jgi:3'-phosphoadenosine 5'-phosphosulfate sulfotransferase (PAPS reductase)/FAD synthetase|nr:phosphoadenosine phosphosulfate reductase family protein [Dysgonamonadaceae bacterium]